MSEIPAALTHKVGPLPLAGWVGIVGGAYVISTYARRRAAGPSALPAVLDGTAAENHAVVGTPATSGPTTNAEWMQLAEKELVSNHGFDPADVDDALRRYITGTDLLNFGEQSIITAAIRFAGPLPQPLPPTDHGPIHLPPHPVTRKPPPKPPYLPHIPTPQAVPAAVNPGPAPVPAPPLPPPAPSKPVPVNDITKAPPEWQNVPAGWYDAINRPLWWE